MSSTDLIVLPIENVTYYWKLINNSHNINNNNDNNQFGSYCLDNVNKNAIEWLCQMIYFHNKLSNTECHMTITIDHLCKLDLNIDNMMFEYFCQRLKQFGKKQEKIIKFKNLKHLIFRNDCNTRYYIDDTHIKLLFHVIYKYCPKLQSLNLSNLKLTNESCIIIKKRIVNKHEKRKSWLNLIDLSRNYGITSDGIQLLRLSYFFITVFVC